MTSKKNARVQTSSAIPISQSLLNLEDIDVRDVTKTAQQEEKQDVVRLRWGY
jgi:hypothetical protein